MKEHLKQAKIRYLKKRKNAYFVIALLSIFSNILLITLGFSLVGYQQVMIVPPVISSAFSISGKKASAEYLAQMGLYFSQLSLNLTPSNVDFQHNILLQNIAADYYSAMKEKLLEDQKRIKASKITLAFYPQNAYADEKYLQVKIPGILKTTIGNDPMQEQKVTYVFKFNYTNGRLWIKSFEEEKKND